MDATALKRAFLQETFVPQEWKKSEKTEKYKMQKATMNASFFSNACVSQCIFEYFEMTR